MSVRSTSFFNSSTRRSTSAGERGGASGAGPHRSSLRRHVAVSSPAWKCQPDARCARSHEMRSARATRYFSGTLVTFLVTPMRPLPPARSPFRGCPRGRDRPRDAARRVHGHARRLRRRAHGARLHAGRAAAVTTQGGDAAGRLGRRRCSRRPRSRSARRSARTASAGSSASRSTPRSPRTTSSTSTTRSTRTPRAARRATRRAPSSGSRASRCPTRT